MYHAAALFVKRKNDNQLQITTDLRQAYELQTIDKKS